jgi:hypothetical protein
VTKIPFFAAGIALGPLIKSSILYAQNAINVRKNKAAKAAINNNKETSEEQETKGLQDTGRTKTCQPCSRSDRSN